MTSARKREANKRNAQRSTGPKNTDITRYNAVTHGMFASQAYIERGLSEEERELFYTIRDGLCADLAPVGTREESLVADIFWCFWSLHRGACFEQDLLVPRLDNRKSAKEESELQDSLNIAEGRLRALGDPGSLAGDQELVLWLFDHLEGQWSVHVSRAMSLDEDWASVYKEFDEGDIKLVVEAARAEQGISEMEFWEKIRVALRRERDDIVDKLARIKQPKSPRHTLVDPVNWNRLEQHYRIYDRRRDQLQRELDRAQAARRSREQASEVRSRSTFRPLTADDLPSLRRQSPMQRAVSDSRVLPSG